MSERLFKTLASANDFVKSMPWITRPFYYVLNKFTPTQTRDDLSWIEEANLVMMEQTPVRAKFLLYAIAMVMMLFLVWAYFSEVEEVSRGEGKVIPSRQVQVIQSLDGGIVAEILVKEGQSVEVGTPLIRIDQTRAISSLRENQSQYYALLAKQSRLKALAEDTPFNPPPEVKKEAQEIYDQEYELYVSSREELRSAVGIANEQMVQREKELLELQYKKESAERVYESTSKELTANKPLLASGAVSEIDILRLEREASRAKGEIDQTRAQISRTQSAIAESRRKINEVTQNFNSKVRYELNDTTAKLNSLSEVSISLQDRVNQTTMKSPVNGKVSRLFFNTVGGVIQPGKEVLEVVPTDDALILETKIQIKDIAFIREGQTAVVKLTAYDYSIYGALDAIVENVAADSTVDEEGNAYYIVRVRTVKSSLGKGLPIIPGMVAQVDIMTGKKTVLSYLLKPVLKAKSYAFSER